MPFWEFLNAILNGMGFPVPTKAIGKSVAYGTAYALEKVGGILNYFVRFKPKLTRQLVFNMSKNHYFTHSKATQDFGYMPVVNLQEGIVRTLDFYRTGHTVHIDLRLFELWDVTRTSLWGSDKPALSLQPSRAGSTASLDSMEGMFMMDSSRARRLSFPGEKPDEDLLLDDLNTGTGHVHISRSGSSGAPGERADPECRVKSEPVELTGEWRSVKGGRASPVHSSGHRSPQREVSGRKSPGLKTQCPSIPETSVSRTAQLEHAVNGKIERQPVILASGSNGMSSHPMVSTS